VNAKDGFHSELALIDKTLSDTRDSKEHNEGVLACVQMLRGQNASHQIRTKRIELQTQGLRSEWLSAYVLAAGQRILFVAPVRSLTLSLQNVTASEATQSELLYTAVMSAAFYISL
jgi:hypothetical protein